MREIGKKDKNICASKWSAMFDIPIPSLIIAVELGLIEGKVNKHRCDIPESERNKIESLREILQDGNLIVPLFIDIYSLHTPRVWNYPENP